MASFTDNFSTLDGARWNASNVEVSGGKAIIGTAGTIGTISTVDEFTLGSFNFRLEMPPSDDDGPGYVGPERTALTFKLMAENGDHVTAAVTYQPNLSDNPLYTTFWEFGGVRSPETGTYGSGYYLPGDVDPIQWFRWAPEVLGAGRYGPPSGGSYISGMSAGPWRLYVSGYGVSMSEVELDDAAAVDPGDEPMAPAVPAGSGDEQTCVPVIQMIREFSAQVKRPIRIIDENSISMVDPNFPLPAFYETGDGASMYHNATQQLTAGTKVLSMLTGRLALELSAGMVRNDARLLISGWSIPDRLPTPTTAPLPVQRITYTFTPTELNTSLEFHIGTAPLNLQR